MSNINPNLKKVKKIIFVALISMFVISCSKNSEQIEVAKNEVEKNLSEIEKKDINYTCLEMSDREAYNEIGEYHLKRREKAEREYDEFMKENELGKYRTISFEEMADYELESTLKMMKLGGSLLNEVTRHSNSYSEDLKILSKLKGNNTYYMILAVKVKPDTIIHDKIYLDNTNKIINSQYLK